MNPFKTETRLGDICKNSIDPGQTPQNAMSEQGIHCLLTGISMRYTKRRKNPTEKPKTTNKFVQMNRLDESTGQKRFTLNPEILAALTTLTEDQHISSTVLRNKKT